MVLCKGDLGRGVPIALFGSLPSEKGAVADKNRAGEDGREELSLGELGISLSSCIGLVGPIARVDEEGLRGELGPGRACSSD